MIPVVDTRQLQRYRSASYWTDAKAAYMAVVYPGGAPATYVDTVENDSDVTTKPAGCVSITNYTVTSPGGRSGGSSANAQLLIPSATSRNACVVFSAGHVNWATSYAASMESNVVQAILAAGYHVLIFDMPNYGLQPLQEVVINGSLVSRPGKNSYHVPSDATWDSGPSAVRLYTDHVIRSMNTVTRDLGITRFAFVGHSGGGATGTLLCPLESRFSIVHLLQGGMCTDAPTYGSPTDHESWSSNDLYSSIGGTYKEGCLCAAAFAGRRTVVHVADGDEYFADGNTGFLSYLGSARSWIEGNFAGANLETYRKTDEASGTDPNHSISPNQVTYLVQHLLTHMP